MKHIAKIGVVAAILFASAYPSFAFGGHHWFNFGGHHGGHHGGKHPGRGGCVGAPLPVAAFALPSLIALGAAGFGLSRRKG